jgi:phosphoesterase RecJ-like protein
MSLTDLQQFTKALTEAKHILITFKKDFSVDAVAGSLALASVLKQLNKRFDIVCDGFNAPRSLVFLPLLNEIKPKLIQLQKLIVTVKATQAQVEDFSYTFEDGKLKMFVTPSVGGLSAADVSTEQSAYTYDLVITLDTPDLTSLGTIYQQAPNFFYDTTIINIDHQADNEQYGQINLTDVNAVATTEVLFKLLSELPNVVIDKSIATALLTGLITATHSFKTATVTPRTLDIASKLMSLEADKELIIKSLYRSRSLGTMKLWGRIMARLKTSPDLGNKLVWSVLTENDFVESAATVEDLPDVIDELISFIPGIELIAILYQLQGKNCVIVQSVKSHNALYLTKEFQSIGSKHRVTFYVLEKTLAEAEKIVVDKLKQQLG